MPFNYNPNKDIPDLTGKVILVTGGTAGVGKETITQLAKHNPKHIYFTGRNTLSANSLITSLSSSSPSPSSKNLTFIPIDQTSLASVHEGAKTFLSQSNNQLDILICNAGVMAIPPSTSKEGHEIQFAVNHLAHALLIKLCLPALERSREGGGRVVIVTSLAFRSPPKGGIVFGGLRSSMESSFGIKTKWLCYAQSKLANVLYASQLASHCPNITTVAVHPGLVTGTSLTREMGLVDRLIVKGATLRLKGLSVEEGAFNLLWAATGEKKGLRNGEVYEPVGKVVKESKESKDERLGGELWGWTERELEDYL